MYRKYSYRYSFKHSQEKVYRISVEFILKTWHSICSPPISVYKPPTFKLGPRDITSENQGDLCQTYSKSLYWLMQEACQTCSVQENGWLHVPGYLANTIIRFEAQNTSETQLTQPSYLYNRIKSWNQGKRSPCFLKFIILLIIVVIPLFIFIIY